MPNTSPALHYGNYIKAWVEEQAEKQLSVNLCPLAKWMSAWLMLGYPVVAYQRPESVMQLCARLVLLHHIHVHSLASREYAINTYELARLANRPLHALQADLNFLHDYGLALPDVDREGYPVITLTTDGYQLLLKYTACQQSRPH